LALWDALDRLMPEEGRHDPDDQQGQNGPAGASGTCQSDVLSGSE
jgi:hypothetical protein